MALALELDVANSDVSRIEPKFYTFFTSQKGSGRPGLRCPVGTAGASTSCRVEVLDDTTSREELTQMY